ncbi:MAG: Uncharacterized protein Greene041619_109 [Candidatus Peregrinibacteria bacterium Greene0416_19]|nr:MAG: Uncharacterized protein Greene041619_109 [Candidatus Peregrinibacteria bacterium Greene0416_19]
MNAIIFSMQTIQRFFERVWLSMTRPSSYKELLGKPFASGAWYLYWFLFLTSLISIVPASLALFAAAPAAGGFVDELKADVRALFPSELTVTVEDGEVRTNVQEPYYIDMPERWKNAMEKHRNANEDKDKSEEFQHLVAIDTAASAEDYPRYQSLALVTARSIIFRDKNGGYRVQPIGKEVTMMINRQRYQEMTGKVLPYLEYATGFIVAGGIFLLLLAPFAAAGFRLAGYLIYLLVTSVLLFWLGLIMKKKILYADLYKLSFYGLSLPIVYGLVARLVGFPSPYIFTLLFLVWMGGVIRHLPKAKTK